MAKHPLNVSPSPVQSLFHDLATIHAWALLKAACGHSRPFFDDGPDSLPVEPFAPICPVLAGGQEVCHA